MSRFLINLKVSAICTVHRYPNVIKFHEGKLRPVQDKIAHELIDKKCLKNTNILNQWFSEWSISTPRGQLDHPRGR